MPMNVISRSVRRLSESLTKSRGSHEYSDLQQQFGDATDPLVQEIKSCSPGSRVEILGTVRAVSIRPQDLSPAVEIELTDGSGVVKVVWLGRRKIPGIVAGRTMKVCGRLTCHTDRPTIFNPKYELRPLKR